MLKSRFRHLNAAACRLRSTAGPWAQNPARNGNPTLRGLGTAPAHDLPLIKTVSMGRVSGKPVKKTPRQCETPSFAAQRHLVHPSTRQVPSSNSGLLHDL